MGKSKLLFVNYHFDNRSGLDSPLFHHNAAYHLKATLEQHPPIRAGWEVEILDLSRLPFLNRGQVEEDNLLLLREVLQREPTVLAFSLYVWNSEPMHQLARTLGQLAPGIPKVAGGPEVFDRPDFAAQFPAFDVLVEGNGELPLRAILERLAQPGTDLNGIPGVSVRAADGWRHTPTAPATLALEAVPNFYEQHPELIHGVGFYLTTRGCCHGCDYCLWARQPMERKSSEQVRAELTSLLASPGLRQLILFDYDLLEIYSSEPDWFGDLAALVAGLAVDLSINLFTNPANVTDPRVAELVARLQVKRIIVGLQTGEPQVARAVGRGRAFGTLEDLAKVPLALRPRIAVEMVFPLPGETPASFVAALARLLRMGYFRLHLFQLMVLRGTALRRRAGELGLVFDDRPPYLCYQTASSPLADTLRVGALCQVLATMCNVFDGLEDAETTMHRIMDDAGLVGRVLAAIDRGAHPDDIIRDQLEHLFGLRYPGGFLNGEYKGRGGQLASLRSLLRSPGAEDPAS
jgi:hypothetical protein